MASLNENAYGGLADSYAAKYGIPKDVFRTAIRNKTGFDPLYESDNGKGIGGAIMADNNKSLNPFDLDTAFKMAAIVMTDAYSITKDWNDVIGAFGANRAMTAESAKINADAKLPPKNDKAFYQYGMDDVTAWFKSASWGLLFGLIGVVIIIASIYTVITKSK